MNRWQVVGFCLSVVLVIDVGLMIYGDVRRWQQTLRDVERHRQTESVTIELPAVPVWPRSSQQFHNLTEV